MPTAVELQDQADALFWAGKADQAIEKYQGAQIAYLALEELQGATLCLHSLGYAQVYENNPEEGIKALLKAHKAWLGQNRITELGRAERDLGTAHLLNGRLFEAGVWLEKSRNTLGFSNNLKERGLTEARLGRLYCQDGEFDLVDECFDVAFNLLGQADSAPASCMAHIDSAVACMERAQWGHMYNHLELALSMLDRSNGVMRRQAIQLIALRIHWAINQASWDQARHLYQEQFMMAIEQLSAGNAQLLRDEVGATDLEKALILT